MLAFAQSGWQTEIQIPILRVRYLSTMSCTQRNVAQASRKISKHAWFLDSMQNLCGRLMANIAQWAENRHFRWFTQILCSWNQLSIVRKQAAADQTPQKHLFYHLDMRTSIPENRVKSFQFILHHIHARGRKFCSCRVVQVRTQIDVRRNKFLCFLLKVDDSKPKKINFGGEQGLFWWRTISRQLKSNNQPSGHEERDQYHAVCTPTTSRTYQKHICHQIQFNPSVVKLTSKGSIENFGECVEIIYNFRGFWDTETPY